MKFNAANVNNYPQDFDLKGLLDLHKRDVLLSMNCHAIGTVQSFNATAQTVTATINYQRTYYDNPLDPTIPVYKNYPLIVDCPAIVMTGGNAFLTMPISEGDTCLILFNDRDIDAWFASGQVGPVASPRLHSFSDAIALVGLSSSADPIPSYDTSRAVLRNGTAFVGVGTLKVKIGNQTTTLGAILTQINSTLTTFMTAVELAPAVTPFETAVVAAATAALVSLSSILALISGSLE